MAQLIKIIREKSTGIILTSFERRVSMLRSSLGLMVANFIERNCNR